jgi:hypothetical protein
MKAKYFSQLLSSRDQQPIFYHLVEIRISKLLAEFQETQPDHIFFYSHLLAIRKRYTVAPTS